MGAVALRCLQNRRQGNEAGRNATLAITTASPQGGATPPVPPFIASRNAASGGGVSGGVTGDQKLPWELLLSESFASWKYTAVLWGFDPRIDYMSNVKVRLNPSCTSGRYFSVRQHSNDASLGGGTEGPYLNVSVTDGCFKQESRLRLPLPLTSRTPLHAEPEPACYYMKPIQVVGYRDGVAVIQVNSADGKILFYVVHLRTSSVLSVHKEELTSPGAGGGGGGGGGDGGGGKYFLWECVLSPDLSTFVLKPNAMYVLNFCRGEYKNALRWLCCRYDPCRVAKTLFEGSAVRLFVAFDPRCRRRRVALGNVARAGNDVVCLYDLASETVLAESDPFTYQTTHNLAFSPDGGFLASLVLGRAVTDGLFNMPRIIVYETSELRIIYSMETTLLSEVPTLTPAVLFPIFSETGRYLAVAYGEQGPFYQQLAGVRILRAPAPMNLQAICRLVIRDLLEADDINRLPLPSFIKAYLRFHPLHD